MKIQRLNRLKKNAGIMKINNIFGNQQNDSLIYKMPISRVSLNKQLKIQAQKMRQTAAHYRMLYLTSNQVEGYYRMFLINKLHHMGITSHQSFNNPADYQVYINPQIKQTYGQKKEIQQQCLTIPFIKFLVQRYPSIKLQYRDDQSEHRQEIIDGALSQYVQHCINHIDGELLFQYKLTHGKFYFQKDLVHHFPKSSFLLKEYSLRLKDHHQQIKKGKATETDQKFLKMKEDYMERLREQYNNQSRAFSQNIQKKKLKIL